jgi:hypothetical protein
MVVTLLYCSTLRILTVQERTSLPFNITLQAPHTPVPQPTFVPVRPIRRITDASVSFSGSQIIIRSTPFMFSVSFLSRIPALLDSYEYLVYGNGMTSSVRRLMADR